MALVSSSPLTELPTSEFSPATSVNSSSEHNDNGDNDEISVADFNTSSDPLYLPDEGPIAVTSTITPLKNKPHGSRHISSAASHRLRLFGHEPRICILTRAPAEIGLPIEQSHMIRQAIPRQELRQCEWLLGYKAGTFHKDSHFNITYMMQNWHTAFDAGRWLLVPDEPAREVILQSLTRIKNEMTAEISPSAESPWPHFEAVYSNPGHVYRYRFVNISMQSFISIYDPPTQPQFVDVNGEHPLLTVQSHIHPLHVIINARNKIEAWLPAPRDPPTAKIISEMNAIYDIWYSLPMATEFRDHGLKEGGDADHSGLGPPPKTRSHSRHSRSSLGKRSEREGGEGGDDEGGRGREKQRFRFQERHCGTQSRVPRDDVPSLMESCSSCEVSVDWFDFHCMDGVKIWQDSLNYETLPLSEPEDGQRDIPEIGSPKVTGYSGWKPLWDRRWVDTSLFSSNDWAYYYNSCNLVADHLQDR